MARDISISVEPASRVEPSKQPQSMSLRYWGLDWREHQPWELGDGVTVEHGAFDDARPFMRDHYAEVFEVGDGGSGFFDEPWNDAKRRFCGECDVTLFRDGGRTVGVTICHPSDWSTYYFRSMGILPAYHDRGLARSWIARCLPILARYGVARVDTDVAPSNLANIRVMTRLGLNITGTHNSERWGTLVRLTKFLREDAESVFLDKFCSGVRYQRRSWVPPKPERRTP